MKKLLTILSACLFINIASQDANAISSTRQPETVIVATQSAPITSEVTISENKVTKNETKLAKALKMMRGGKSMILAAVLAFFLGSFGLHRFYMGQKKIGLIQLGLTIIGFALYYAGVISALSSGSFSLGILTILGVVLLLANRIWTLIDMVRILMGNLEPDGGFDD